MADPIALPKKAYDPEISGLRGLALLIVVGGHFIQRIERFNPPEYTLDWKLRLLIDSFASPAAGVYLFFSVSGYLIARSFQSSTALNLCEIKRFYLRRAVRIIPPYAFVLFVTYTILIFLPWEPPNANLYKAEPQSISESLLASLGGVHGIIYGTYPRLFPPGWTLEVEIQFYILSPLLWLILSRLTIRFGLGATSAIVLGASGVVALGCMRSSIAQLQPTILVYMPLFLLGMVTYCVKKTGWLPVSRFTSKLGWIALIGFIVIQPWMSGQGVEIASRMILISILFSATIAGRGTFYSFCSSPILVRIGAASYSFYLVHLQIIHLVSALTNKYVATSQIILATIIDALVSIIVVFIVSRIFFIVIEKPTADVSNRLYASMTGPVDSINNKFFAGNSQIYSMGRR